MERNESKDVRGKNHEQTKTATGTINVQGATIQVPY